MWISATQNAANNRLKKKLKKTVRHHQNFKGKVILHLSYAVQIFIKNLFTELFCSNRT